MKQTFILLATCLLFILNANATIRTTVSSGSWNNAAIWGGTVPATNDDVVISSGHTVTINVNPNNIVNVTINGILQWDATGTGRTLDRNAVPLPSMVPARLIAQHPVLLPHTLLPTTAPASRTTAP
jgi:hypothetical protein